MKRTLAVVLLLFAIGGTACAGSTDASEPGATDRSSTEAAGDEQTATPSPQLLCEDRSLGIDNYSGRRESRILSAAGGRVPAQANIFAAGRDAPPAPGGGGGGVLPPVFLLPTGSSRVVTFPSITGRVNPIIMYPDWNGPAGDMTSTIYGTRGGPTDVESFQGISGIVHRTNGMFLVGVFLTEAPPSNPAPPRLDFTDGEQFDVLEPGIGQVFLIGDGKGRSYAVPDEATRLFLGFADAFLYEGCPGWYGNNAGHLTLTVDVTEA